MAQQTFIVQIDEDLARSVRRHFKGESGRGYVSMNEFFEMALLNQLNAEAAAVGAGEPTSPYQPHSGRDLLTPPGDPPNELPARANAVEDPLFVLTNRFGPMKIAARVLANLRAQGGWPQLQEFQLQSARVARELGLRLRAEDASERRTGYDRRWVAFPVGSDERAATDRYAFSFTLTNAAGRATGPMAVLGFANLAGDRALLTASGWALAAAPSPLVDGAAGSKLSDEESKIFRNAIAEAPGERAAVVEFLELGTRAGGMQTRMDELIAAQHPDWTAELAVAHRAAMLGRLGDIGVLQVSGRGSKAIIRLLPEAWTFALNETSQEAQ